MPRVAQVFVAAVKKWNVTRYDGRELYEVEGLESAIKGSRKILHTHKFQQVLIVKLGNIYHFTRVKSSSK